MKKIEFIELVQHILTNGDMNPDLETKYHEGVVNLLASMAFSNAIYEVFRRQLDEKDLYTRRYQVTVLYDETTDEYYSELPALVMQLPMNSGIHKISPITERWSFNQINQQSEDVFDLLEVGQLVQDPSFWFDSTRIHYQYYNWKNQQIQKAHAWLVIPLEAYADEEQLVIPAGKEDLILQFVKDHLAQQLPGDDSQNLDEKQL